MGKRWAIVFVALLGCGDVSVFDRFEPVAGVIEGSIVVQIPPPSGSICETSRTGDLILSVFSVEDPPPPEGTGGAVSFIVLPEAQVFDSRVEDDLRAVPFTIPSIRTGRYTLRGFVDRDGDFNPQFGLTSQPTAFDVVGGAVDPETGAFREVPVEDGFVTRNVAVTVGQAVPVERPAFVATSSSVEVSGPLVLQAVAFDRGPVQVDPACGGFLVQARDPAADGKATDRDGDGLVDLYPRVLFTRAEPDGSTILVPGVVDPTPFEDGLPAVTSTLTVYATPLAFSVAPDGSRTELDGVPPGAYGLSLLSGTGQTWTVPNGIDEVHPPGAEGPTESQLQTIELRVPSPPGAGNIRGTLAAPTSEPGPTWVFAFDASDPPPPAGAGRPRGAVRVSPQDFVDLGGGTETADYVLSGLSDGNYVVQALRDVDGNFNPWVPLYAQPSAADRVGRLAGPVAVRAGEGAAGTIDLSDRVGFERPAFTMAPRTVDRADLPASLRIRARALLGAPAELPTALAGEDADGDNVQDLLPRVVLTRIPDAGDPRTAPDLADAPRWLGLVDPIPVLDLLAQGPPIRVEAELDLLLLPVALTVGGRAPGPPPPGRYRVNLLSFTGQTWSVPNDVDLRLDRVGTDREDPGQAAVVTLTGEPLPAGAIRVEVTGPAGADVVLLAYSAAAPPPPVGEGRPVATAFVPSQALPGGTGEGVLQGLGTGAYQIHGVADRNGTFIPWYPTTAQADAGDAVGTVAAVQVDALAAPAQAALILAEDVPQDPPAFVFDADAVGGAQRTVELRSLQHTSSLLRFSGTFPVQWIDGDEDGLADDIDGDGDPDVYPLVFARPLDRDGPTIRGTVDPSRVGGFPAGDPSQVDVEVATDALRVRFPPLSAFPGAQPGAYALTVVNRVGQIWSVPNELSRNRGTDLVESQGRVLTFAD